MTRPPTASFAVALMIMLLASSLPGAMMPGLSAAPPHQARTNEAAGMIQALLTPTGYDRLHHASPSTPWTAFTGRGVNAVLGNFVRQEQDLVIPGRGLPLAVTRTYNSASTGDGPLGPGWTHSYNLAVIPDGADAVLVRNADGRLDRFSRQPDGSYVAPAGIHNLLTRAADGTYTLITKNQTVYRFDTSGRLTRIGDKNENAVLLAYSGGDLTGITDTVGRAFTLVYDGAHRLTELRDPAGRVVHFAHLPDGRLASVTDPLGHVTLYGYTSGYLTAVTDANGHTPVSNTFDAQGRVTEQRDALGNTTTFAYDWGTGRTTVNGPRGGATVYTADTGYRLTAIRDAAGHATTTAYDAANNRISVTDRRGATSYLAYDERGNLVQAADAAGGISYYSYDSRNNLLESQDALGRLTTFTYDARGNRLTVTDPLGQVTTYGYDGHGQILSTADAGGRTTTRAYDGQGNLISETDALGQVKGFGYDALGRMNSQTDPAGAATQYGYDAGDRLIEVTDAAGHKTTSTYDAVGNRTRATDKNGHATEYAYDAANRLTQVTDAAGGVTRYTYDADGNRTGVTDAANATTASEYDLLNRLVRVTDPLGNANRYGYDANGNRTVITDTLGQATTFTYDVLNRVTAATDPLGETSTTAYDAVGNAIARTDARGNATHFEYDVLNRLVAVTDAAGSTVRYYYDSAGNRTAIVDAKGSAAASAATAASSIAVDSQAGAMQSIYDAANRLAETVDPLGNRTRYAYDAAGNLVGKTDAVGQATAYEYDTLGRLVKAIYPDNTITYHYDAAGNRTHVIDIQGVTRYEYDALNRVVRVTDPAGQKVGYAYDALGRRTQLTYPDGRAVTYAYDPRGRMATVTDWDGNATGYTYNARGQLSRVVYPNGTSIEYAYDAAGRLTDIVHRDAGGQILLPIHYDLDANGNRLAMTDNRGAESYTYDDLDRLAQVAYADGETVSYTYDEAGNRLSMTSSVHGGTTYEYNVADQLLRMTAPDSTVTDFAYDANGNMIRKGSVEYLFDGANRLTQVIDGENWVAFTYDGDGHRLTKTANLEGASGAGETTTYATDVVSALPQVIAEVRGGQAISYTYGLALNSIAEPGAGWRYYHADGLGSVRALSDAGGGAAAGYSYDVFGASRGQSGMTGNALTYTGQQFDAETGLLYLRARYYDPVVGRFLSSDPVTTKFSGTQVANRFSYVQNNPTMFVDPRGLEAEYADGLIFFTPEAPMDIGDEIGLDERTIRSCTGLPEKDLPMCYLDNLGVRGSGSYNPLADIPEDILVGIRSDVFWQEIGVTIPKKLGVAYSLISGLLFGQIAGAGDSGDQCSFERRNFIGDLWTEYLDEHSDCRHYSPEETFTRTMLHNDSIPATVHTSVENMILSQGGNVGSSSSRPDSDDRMSVPRFATWIEEPSEGGLLLGGRYRLRAKTTGPVERVQFLAYYATDPNNIDTVTWRHLCWAQRVGDAWSATGTWLRCPTRERGLGHRCHLRPLLHLQRRARIESAIMSATRCGWRWIAAR